MDKVLIHGRSFSVEGATLDRQPFPFDLVQLDANAFHMLHDGHSYTLEVLSWSAAGKTMELKVNGKPCTLRVLDRFDQLMEQMGFSDTGQTRIRELRAPMPGLVIDIRVQAGDSVQKGDAVLVLEAMKMENVLKASGDGKVKSVEVQKGKGVEKNQVLIVFI